MTANTKQIDTDLIAHTARIVEKLGEHIQVHAAQLATNRGRGDDIFEVDEAAEELLKALTAFLTWTALPLAEEANPDAPHPHQLTKAHATQALEVLS